jgi:RNA polymerase sigma-70 factor (ECF subfamily)
MDADGVCRIVRCCFQTGLAEEKYGQFFPHFCNKPILEAVFQYEKHLSMIKSDDLAQIIIGCQKGDADCFSQLVDMYASRFYGYFYRLTGKKDTCDELLSILFAKLVEKIGSYKGGSFESWLFRIASNVFHDYLRSKQRYTKLLDARISHLESEITEPKQSNSDRIDKLQMQLGRLDADTRELIMLRFYSQLSFKEIAKMRYEPIGTTLSKLHRGLKKLRELMEG